MRLGRVLCFLLLLSISMEENCTKLPKIQDYGPLIAGPVIDVIYLKRKTYKLSKEDKCDGERFTVSKVDANNTNDRHLPAFLNITYCDWHNAWVGEHVICPTFNCPIFNMIPMNDSRCFRGELMHNDSCGRDGFANELYGICFYSKCSLTKLRLTNSYIERNSLGEEKEISRLRIQCIEGFVMRGKSRRIDRETFCRNQRWTKTNFGCYKKTNKSINTNASIEMEKLEKIGYTGYPTMVPENELFGLTPYYVFFSLVLAVLMALRILYYFSEKIAFKKAQKLKHQFIILRNNELKEYLNNADFKRYNEHEGPTTEMKVTEKSTVRPKTQDIVARREYMKSLSSEEELASLKDEAELEEAKVEKAREDEVGPIEQN